MGKSESLQSRLFGQAEAAGERRAMAWAGRSAEFAWRSYEDLHRDAAARAGILADSGLAPGRVCILALPSTELCASLLLAVLWRGAIPLLIAPPVMQGFNPTLLRTLRHVIRKTDPALVVIAQSMSYLQDSLPRGRGAPPVVVAEDTLTEADAGAAIEASPPALEVAALQLTSGTTGLPKVCVWSHANVLAAVEGMRAAMDLGADDVCLNWTPLYHDMGLVNNFFLCFATGTPLAMLNPNDFIRSPALWLRALHNAGATVTWSPNFGFAVAAERVKDEEIAAVRLDGVRGFWNAAERIHYETMQAFHRRFQPYGVAWEALKTNFGCAENVGGATFSDAHAPFKAERIDVEALHRGVARPAGGETSVWVVSTGAPYPGLEVAVLSARGERLAEGRVGRVALRSPSAMQGYLGLESESRKALRDGLLLTGDLGYLREGELFWTGRVKERIKVRGRSLDPSDFEEALLQVDDLRKGCFAAFGLDDARLGTEEVVLVSELVDEPRRPYSQIAAAVRDQVSRRLGLTPGEVILVERGALTKTSSGKRRHRHFKQQYLAGNLPWLYSSKEARS